MSIRMNRAMALLMGLTMAVAPVVANAQRGPGGGGGPGGGHDDGRRGGGGGPRGGGDFRGGGGGGPHGGMWRRGDRYNGGGVFVDNWRGYRGLYAPPPGYRWIDYGGSFLLAAIATGIISSVVAGSAYGSGAPVATPYPTYPGGAYPATAAPYPAQAYPAAPYPTGPGY